MAPGLFRDSGLRTKTRAYGWNTGKSLKTQPKGVVSEMPTRRFINVAKAAATYSVSKQTIYRRVWDGTLTAYRPGKGSLRLDPAEVEAAFREIR